MPRLTLRDLFGAADRPIDRWTYASWGIGLMLFKYIVDATVIWWFAGVTWTPIDYLVPLISLKEAKVNRMPGWLPMSLFVWTLPFIWIGVTLSVRRALETRLPPAIVVAFFVPFLNYALMLTLAVAPPAPWEQRDRSLPMFEPSPSARRRKSTALGVIAGVLTGFVLIVAAFAFVKSYGGTLFLLIPFGIGFVSAIVANTIVRRERYESLLVGVLALGAIGGVMMLIAFEGALCIVMAVPVTVPLQLMGSFIGHVLGRLGSRPLTSVSILLLLTPAGSGLERLLPAPSARVVLTSIDIAAPPETVWTHVVSFSEIRSRPEWYFRTGLAYPLRARIDGRGVGAVRYCEFTTGAFVEPITVWDEPRTLAFSVATQPPPLHEWSPYSRVYAPHLDGFFKTWRGEFRLVPLEGGGTRLEGRTWYTLDMQPAIYWTAIADAILHGVHDRVLEHVKAGAQGTR